MNDEQKRYKVSIIVLTYNPNYDKLELTIKSLLAQKNIDFQIVITDDGSKKNYFDKLNSLFEQMKFKDFVLVESKVNSGTCLNYKRGLDKSAGKYIKAISPGDFLYDELTLASWSDFMEANKCKVSFGDTVYYNNNNNNIYYARKEKIQPQRIELYDSKNYRENAVILNYIYLLDPVVGAAFLVEKELLVYYLDLLLNKIVYAEDNIFRIMVCDGIHLIRYNKNVIFYEYGTGISTSKNHKWAEIIKNEIIITNKIIRDRIKNKSIFMIKMKWLLSISYKSKQYTVLKYILFPSLIYWKIVKEKNIRYTFTDIDIKDVLRRIL
ncbi:glycosyltransferase [Clostridium sp. SM-530-WT-3G]|uniref:glycosyltransferase family 2 protein n=1 Tax=Clostridium sp. SM-530-WT-3G TaxID=2725303 RepID=UPI00145CD547|nr:glycosyltransferase [Clostridium sp. SM-530-WT-3G]NME83739.1 glycosyltransferase family 2 protein [Clostridium sp. SM-530-WT-3G]